MPSSHVALLLMAALPLAQSELSWCPTVRTAQLIARKTDRPVMAVVLLSENAGWRITQALQDPRVASTAKRFVPVRVTSPQAFEALGNSLDAAPFSALIFVDGNGRLLSRLSGFLWAREVLDACEQVEWSVRSEAALIRDARERPRDVAVAAKLAVIRAMRGDMRAALALLKAAEAGKGPRDFITRGYGAIGDYLRSRSLHREAIPHLQRAWQLAPASRLKFQYGLRLGSSLFRSGDTEKAERILSQLRALPNLEKEDAAVALTMHQRVRGVRPGGGR